MILDLTIGPMFSGKTTKLVNNYYGFIEDNCGSRVLMINHSFDTRYSKSTISTHDKDTKINCHMLHELSTITPEFIKTEGINARYDRDYELEENSNYKQERLYILNKYKTDDFHPYQNQGDLRVIQKALSEQGYKLPKSTKQDGSFDGVWGDETKNALLKYRKSQNKTKQ